MLSAFDSPFPTKFDAPIPRFWWCTDPKKPESDQMPRDSNGYLSSEVISHASLPDVPERGTAALPESEEMSNVALTLSVSALQNAFCVILLGEAGIGKSREVERELKRLRELPEAPFVVFVDAHDIKEREDWIEDVLKNQEIENWLKDPEAHLQLWLDGLDESPWRIESLMKSLWKALEGEWQESRSRLHLRIISRPLVWNEQWTTKLKDLWEAPLRCELCPPRAQDVRDFALAAGLDADEFWKALDRLRAHNFALRPRTLIWLAYKFSRGELSSQTSINRAALFEECILKNCETTSGRTQKGHQEQLSVDARLRIVKALAAYSLLSGRTFLGFSNSMESDVSRHELRLGEILLGAWNAQNADFWQDARSREVLDTPLFRRLQFSEPDSAVREVFRFAERTDAEYLAARFLCDDDIQDAQILNLLCHSAAPIPGRDAPRVVPQLKEVAAWLANLRPSLRSELFRRDPRALLESDLSVWEPDAIGDFIRALLGEIEEEKFFNRDFSLSLADFNNPQLADQLAPFIFNPKFSVFTRRAAIDIAERSPTAFSLAPRLAGLALQEGEEINIRIEAAHAVHKMNDEDAKSQLKSLALAPPIEDQSNELQGAALFSIWPRYLSARELFGVLKPPKDELFGAYRSFLYYLPSHLRDEDIPVALVWCAKQRQSLYGRGEDYSFDWAILLHGLFIRATEILVGEGTEESLKNSTIRAFGAALATRYREHDLTRVWNADKKLLRLNSDLHEMFGQLSDETRRAVLAQLCPRLRRFGHFRHVLLHDGPRWIYERDFGWILGQLRAAPQPDEAQAWGELADILFVQEGVNQDPDAIALLQAELNDKTHPHYGQLSSNFAMWFRGLELSSAQAQELRTNYERWQGFEREQTERKSEREREAQERQRQIAQYIETHLAKCESGDVESWWVVDYALIQDRDGGYSGSELGTHLNNSNIWQASDEALRERFFSAALAYLKNFSPQSFPKVSADWQTSTTFHRVLAAAHRALLLLFLEAPARFEALSDDVLQKWAPVVVWFPWQGGETWQSDNQNLLAAITERVPETVASAVAVHIEKDAQRDGYVFALRKVGFRWPNAFTARMIDLARAQHIAPVALNAVLSELLQREAVPFWVEVQKAPATRKTFANAPEKFPAHQLAQELFVQAFDFGNSRTRRTKSSAKARNRKKLQRADATYTTRGERAAEIALAMMGGAFDGGWPLVWRAFQDDSQWGAQVMLDYTARFDVRGKALFVNDLDETSLADWFLWLHAQFPSEEDVRVMGAHFISTREQLTDVRDGLLRRLQNKGTHAARRELERIKNSLPTHWVKYILPDAEQAALQNSWQPPSPHDLNALLRDGKYRFVGSGEAMLDVVMESLNRAQTNSSGQHHALSCSGTK